MHTVPIVIGVEAREHIQDVNHPFCRADLDSDVKCIGRRTNYESSKDVLKAFTKMSEELTYWSLAVFPDGGSE